MAFGNRKIKLRREQLKAHNDFLRLRLSLQCEQLRPVALWIEQGYNLARHLAQPTPGRELANGPATRSRSDTIKNFLLRLLGMG